MTQRLPTLASPSAPVLWSLMAGVYAVGCSIVLLLTAGPLPRLVADVLLVPGVPEISLAVPVAVAVPFLWWRLVECSNTPTYVRGAVVGASAAALTVGFWTLVTVSVWGVEVVPTVSILIGFLLAVTVPAGAVGGVPPVVVRRRFGAD